MKNSYFEFSKNQNYVIKNIQIKVVDVVENKKMWIKFDQHFIPKNIINK